MDIESLVGNIESIFNPKVSFEGFFSIGSHIISKASNYNNNINLVQAYLYKKYYRFIYENFDSFLQSIEIPIYFFSELNNGYGRQLVPFVDIFISDYIESLFYYKFPDNIIEKAKEDEKFIYNENKKFLKEKKKNINAILNGAMNIEDDKDLLKAYMIMKEPMRKRIKQLDDSDKTLRQKLSRGILISNDEKLMIYILTELKNYSTKILLYYDSIAKEMNKPLILSDLNDLVDYNILYLRLAKVSINIIKNNLKENEEPSTVVLFLYKYYNALKVLKDYNYTIDASDLLFDGEKKRKYSTQDFIREFESIVLPINEPEIRYYQIMEKDDSIDYRDINNVKKKIEYLKDVDNSRELAVGWDFVPKGELLEPREKTSTRYIRTSSKVNLEEREERLAKVLKRQQFLDNTPYIYKAQGKNKFDGYVAYLYGNGFVLFEKFYENQKNKTPSKSNATYIMTIDNFVEMSRLSKPEIMDYIKAGNTDVMRKNHTSSWETNILGIINSAFYSEKTKEKIDRLISLGKLEKTQELRKEL